MGVWLLGWVVVCWGCTGREQPMAGGEVRAGQVQSGIVTVTVLF